MSKATNGAVTLNLHDKATLKSSITMAAIDQLGLELGGQATAIIKATDIMIGVE